MQTTKRYASPDVEQLKNRPPIHFDPSPLFGQQPLIESEPFGGIDPPCGALVVTVADVIEPAAARCLSFAPSSAEA